MMTRIVYAALLLLASGVREGGVAAVSMQRGDLEPVLAAMDQSAENFRSAQADVEVTQYQKVVNDTDVQKGQIYFRRTNRGMEVALHIAPPDSKQVVVREGKLRMYQPRINTITERELGADKAVVESFMSLGFGGHGHELTKSYDVAMDGWETLDGVKTARLELTPKSPKARNLFSKIILWTDPRADVLVKQQMFEPSGDYRLAHYTNIRLNAKVAEEEFKIKAASGAKTVQQ